MRDNNILTLAYDRIKEFAKSNKKFLIKATFICLAVGYILTLMLLQVVTNAVNFLHGIENTEVYILSLIGSYFIHGYICIPIHLFLSLLILYVVILIKKVSRFQGEYDKERDLTRLTQGTKGTGKLLQGDSLKECYDLGAFGDYDSNIFGCIDGKYKGNSAYEEKAGKILVYQRDYGIDANMNLLVTGIAGTGKTRKKVLLDIFQCLSRGESVITSDTKGDLVRLLYCYAHDYLKIPTKIINFKPDELIYSDAIDIFSLIGDYSEICKIDDPIEREQEINNAQNSCEALAMVIRQNLSLKALNRDADFWDLEGINYIKFWVNFVFFNLNIPKYQKNFKYISDRIAKLQVRTRPDDALTEGYDGFVEDLVKELDTDVLKATCEGKLLTMLGGSPTVKSSVHSGLGITLSPMQNPLIQKITSNNEVDLSLPAKKQCLYFLVMDSQDTSNRFLVASVLTLLYQQLVKYINTTKDIRADVPVNLILDEMTNIGKIPNLPTHLAEMRSKLIRHELFVQSWALAKTVYTEEEWEAIKTNCAYWELLGTNEDEVLGVFSEKSDKMTVLDESERKVSSKFKIVNFVANTTNTLQAQEREVLTKGEVEHLKDYEILILKTKNHMAKIHAWDYTNHPEWKHCTPYHTTMHLPLWRIKEQKEYEQKAKRDKEIWETA